MDIVLDEKQSLALDLLKRGKNVLVTGPGGSGKSMLVTVAVRDFVARRKKVGVTSTTGQSANLIGGCTLHSFLGISLGDMPSDLLVQKIQRNSRKKKNWCETDLLIVDEVSMLDPVLFSKLNCIAKNLRRDTRPFGGMQLMLSGDFYQLPVVKSERFVFEADCWKECIEETVVLTSVKRQEDSEFREMLNRLRVGRVTSDDVHALKLLGKKRECDMTVKPTKLFCNNAEADAVNARELDALDADVYVYHVQVYKTPNTPARFDPSKKCNAPETLKLCAGADVLLLCNLDQENGLVNGSRGTVVSFNDRQLPVVAFPNRVTRTIDYNIWEIKEDGIVVASVSQVPLRLAYAITIHKSQGMTLESAMIDLARVFEYGQAYVALSRVKTAKNLIVRNVTRESFKVHPKARGFYDSL